MSFLRKRSRSQCSYSKGDDEISITRSHQKEINRTSRADSFQSTASSSSDASTSDIATHESCVLRNFPKHKSSHVRFLAWVAFTRKYTDEYISEDERRTCPLLWCRSKFKDQEEMLRHVWNCPHLSKGQYWCFHCEKWEQVGKFQCRKCQGVPSRTDRMASVAKRIFSKLGAKHHHLDQSVATTQTSGALSKIAEASESAEPPDYPYRERAMDWNHEYIPIQELPSDSICPEMAADWSAAAQELPDNHISEMPGSDRPVELDIGTEDWADNFYTDNLEDWDIPSTTVKPKGTSPKLARLNTSFTSLNTQVMYGSHGHASHQHSSTWSNTPLSATIVSPLSATGGFESNTLDVSPTDSEASGKSYFTDSGYSTQSSWNLSPASANPFDIFKDKKGKDRDFGTMSDDWFNNDEFLRPLALPALMGPPSMGPQSLPSGSEGVSRSSSSASRVTIIERPKLSSPHWSDPKSLVQSFSEALDAHISHTKAVLRELPSTPMGIELLAMSKTSMVSIGLEALTGILEGRTPSAVVQIFAFTHIACAFAIAVDHDESNIHTRAWFKASLSWTRDLASDRQRQTYLQISHAIWQPGEVSGGRTDSDLLDQEHQENRVFWYCKHFLDVLESLQDTEKALASSQTSSELRFDFPHAMFELRARTRVLDELFQKAPAFIQEVVKIETRLLQGQIKGIRELELELICAGKLASQPDAAYRTFHDLVIKLCDLVYAEEGGSTQSRKAYHVQNVSLVKQLITEEHHDFDSEPGSNQHDALYDDHDDHEHNLDHLLDFDFDAIAGHTQHSVEISVRDGDDILNQNFDFNGSFHIPQPSTPLSRIPSLQPAAVSHQAETKQSSLVPGNHTPFHTLPTVSTFPLNPASDLSNDDSHQDIPNASIASASYRCHCGYEPAGEEKWKASNLRRHKRTQHPVEVKIHACKYPGCTSTFTRSDNLRSHQRDKGHETGVRTRALKEVSDEEPRVRGPKRRKIGDSNAKDDGKGVVDDKGR